MLVHKVPGACKDEAANEILRLWFYIIFCLQGSARTTHALFQDCYIAYQIVSVESQNNRLFCGRSYLSRSIIWFKNLMSLPSSILFEKSFDDKGSKIKVDQFIDARLQLRHLHQVL